MQFPHPGPVVLSACTYRPHPLLEDSLRRGERGVGP